MEQYLPILLLLGLVLAFTLASAAGSRMLGPKRPTGAKEGPYESGIVSKYLPAARFPVRFYLVAMIFVIFDIEVVFLYPWAVMYHQLGLFGLVEVAVFSVVVVVAFAFLVSNGALDWGPRQRQGKRLPAELAPTTTSTVRRVPRPPELVHGATPLPITDGETAEERPAGRPAQSA